MKPLWVKEHCTPHEGGGCSARGGLLFFKRYQFDFSFNYSITNDAIEIIFPLFCRDNSMRSVMNED